jgi:hypothetical protein
MVTQARDLKNILAKLRYVIIPKFNMESDPEGVKELRNCKIYSIKGIYGDLLFYVYSFRCSFFIIQHLKYGHEFKWKLVRNCLLSHVGRCICCDNQYETPRRKDFLLPMRLCSRILHLSYRTSSSSSTFFEDYWHWILLTEVSNCRSFLGLVNNGYSFFHLGSISFMNVIIEE